MKLALASAQVVPLGRNRSEGSWIDSWWSCDFSVWLIWEFNGILWCSRKNRIRWGGKQNKNYPDLFWKDMEELYNRPNLLPHFEVPWIVLQLPVRFCLFRKAVKTWKRNQQLWSRRVAKWATCYCWSAILYHWRGQGWSIKHQMACGSDQVVQSWGAVSGVQLLIQWLDVRQLRISWGR